MKTNKLNKKLYKTQKMMYLVMNLVCFQKQSNNNRATSHEYSYLFVNNIFSTDESIFTMIARLGKLYNEWCLI